MRTIALWLCPSLALAQRASEFETSGGLAYMTPAGLVLVIIYMAVLIRWPAEAFIGACGIGLIYLLARITGVA